MIVLNTSNEGGSVTNPVHTQQRNWNIDDYAAHLGVPVEELHQFQIAQIWRN